MISSATANHGADTVVVPDGVLEALQNHNTDALTAAIAIGTLIKGETLSIRAQQSECLH